MQLMLCTTLLQVDAGVPDVLRPVAWTVFLDVKVCAHLLHLSFRLHLHLRMQALGRLANVLVCVQPSLNIYGLACDTQVHRQPGYYAALVAQALGDLAGCAQLSVEQIKAHADTAHQVRFSC